MLAPNLTDEACDAEEPHGYTWRMTGTSSAPISRYDVQIMGVDTMSRLFTVTPTASGRFTLSHSVCLDAYAEDVNFRFRVFDSRGNVSNPVNLAVPVRDAATLTAFTVTPARDEDLHVLRMSGLAPAHNLEFIRSDILDGTTTIAEDFDVSIADLGARYAPDDTYEAIALISGVDGAGIDRYDGRVVTFGGRESTVRTASIAIATPGSTEPCVPAVDAFTTTCIEGLVCRSSGGPMRGTCRTATGSAPVLTSIVDGRFLPGDEICGDEFPNGLLRTMVGASSEAITGFSIQAEEFGPDPFAFEIIPRPGGSFRVETGLCLAGDPPATVQIRAIDEAGRESGPRSFSP